MYEFKMLEASDVSKIRELYFQEEDIQIDSDIEMQNHDARMKNVYNVMLSRGSYIYGCFDNDTLIAAITVNKCLDIYPGYTDKPYVHLETFIVHKQYQNKGVGTQLLTRVIKRVKEEECTYVIMQSNNPFVQRIAQKVGLNDSLIDMRTDFVAQ